MAGVYPPALELEIYQTILICWSADPVTVAASPPGSDDVAARRCKLIGCIPLPRSSFDWLVTILFSCQIILFNTYARNCVLQHLEIIIANMRLPPDCGLSMNIRQGLLKVAMMIFIIKDVWDGI
jgi:hypothetical protein